MGVHIGGEMPHQAPRRCSAGETIRAPGNEGFDEAPSKCLDDYFFGLQLTSPFSSISPDIKNKEERSPRRLESGPLLPSAPPKSKSKASAS